MGDRLATQTTHCGSSTPRPSAQLFVMATSSAPLISQGIAPGIQRDGRHLVTWTDATHGGTQGMGPLNELERRGLRVGAPQAFGRLATEQRVMDPAEATARIHLATGAWVQYVGRQPGAILLSYSEPRTPAMQKESEGLRTALAIELLRLGRKDALAMLIGRSAPPTCRTSIRSCAWRPRG